MKVMKIWLIVLFALLMQLPSECLAEKIGFYSTNVNGSLGLRASNVKPSTEKSVSIDIALINRTATWYLITREQSKVFKEPQLDETQIPLVFLIGPNQIKRFQDIEFSEQEVLQFSSDRANLITTLMLAIDLIFRGIFSRELSLDEIDSLLAGMSIEFIESIINELNEEELGHLCSFAIALSDNDWEQALKSFGNLILSIKGTKKLLWELVKKIGGEKNSIIVTIAAQETIKGVLKALDLYNKTKLLIGLAVATHRAPVDDIVWIRAIAKPFAQLSGHLIIKEPPFYVNDIVTAEFTIINDGLDTLIMKELTMFGEGPGGQFDIYSFPSVASITLEPEQSYFYYASLRLTNPGIYHFTWDYQNQKGKWQNYGWLTVVRLWNVTINNVIEIEVLKRLGKPGKPKHVDD